ncbi:alpha-glucosidase, partial [Escherichia coli]|nr:alpha-glucosidase [Escherichia coli]
MDTPRPQLLDFQFHQNNDSFTLHFQQRLILTHSKDNPCLWIGSGIADIDMFHGNFGNDSNLLIVFYVQIMPDDFVMQLHR